MYHITDTWDFTINSNHTLQLEVKEGLLGDRLTLWQNGSKLFQRTIFFHNLRGKGTVQLDGTELDVQWRWKFAGGSVVPAVITLQNGTEVIAQYTDSLSDAAQAEAQPATPWWAWGLIGVCLLLPVLTVGGPIGIGAAAFGFFGIRGIATDAERSVNDRLLFSVGIVLFLYAVVPALTGGFALLAS